MKKKKKNLYNLYIYILLTLIILGLSGYLVYDKFLKPNTIPDNNNDNIPSYDLYAVKVNDPYITFAFIRDNKLYYGQKERSKSDGLYPSIYSGSKYVEEDLEMRVLNNVDNVKRIETCFLDGEDKAPTYLLVLEDGTVKKIAEDFSKVETYKDLADYKVNDIISCNFGWSADKTGENYLSTKYSILLLDGSSKYIDVKLK